MRNRNPNQDRDNALKNRLIDILGRGTAGVGVASSKTIRADAVDEDLYDVSYSITSSRSFTGELAIEIIKGAKDADNLTTTTKSKLVFERNGAKGYVDVNINEADAELVLEPIGDANYHGFLKMLQGVELINTRDAEIKRQVKETESLRKSLEKLSQISRDPSTSRKLQNHPTEANDGTTYSYEVTEDTNANDVVTYNITRIHKAAPAVEIVDDKRMSRIVFEPGKKTKGFLNYSQEDINTLMQAYEEGGVFYQEGREFKESDLLGDLVSGNAANSDGIGEYEDAVGSIEQGKSQSKTSNTVANDGLKTRISDILGRGTFGGVASSKDIEVNNFTIGNYSYKITSSTTRLGGSSFSIERTTSEPDGTRPVVTHNKLVFEKGKTAVGYVNKANAGDSQLSQITPDDRREYGLMLEILDRVNTRDTENKAQLETAAPLVKSLEGLVKKFTKNPQELSRLQILDNGGLVDIDAGTDTYRATKTVAGNVTTYDVIKTHYSQAGEEEGEKKIHINIRAWQES